ncbi:uncharacterized protein G2W53_033541 [Senna tora]|uniref:Uncharacterized protein n=1 Tax=Senna tora TaxID=362788 RepID=A0A834T0R5_9FABA|nr:uncharacterized protein G2W53_033541 [Senna tora]
MDGTHDRMEAVYLVNPSGSIARNRTHDCLHGRCVKSFITYFKSKIAIESQKNSRSAVQMSYSTSESKRSLRVVFWNSSGSNARWD